MTQPLAPYVLPLRLCEKQLFTLEAQKRKTKGAGGLSLCFSIRNPQSTIRNQ